MDQQTLDANLFFICYKYCCEYGTPPTDDKFVEITDNKISAWHSPSPKPSNEKLLSYDLTSCLELYNEDVLIPDEIVERGFYKCTSDERSKLKTTKLTDGDVIFNIDTKCVEVYINANWIALSFNTSLPIESKNQISQSIPDSSGNGTSHVSSSVVDASGTSEPVVKGWFSW